jgi:uncharacterized protein YggE
MEKRVEFTNEVGQASLIGSIIIFFVLLFVYSKFGPSLPINITTQTKGEPFIVSAEGKIVVVPDIAKVTVGFEEKGNNLKAVQDSVNRKSKNLTDEVKKLGVKEEDIKTVNYNVYPEYDYMNTPYKINSYRVSTNYEIKVTDFEIVNDLLTVATDNGANVIGNISFEVNDKTRDEKIQEARKEAVEKAKTKAEGLAKASGITLGKILNVQESENDNYPMPIMYTKELTIDSSENSREVANVTPGETEIIVSISLSYEIR